MYSNTIELLKKLCSAPGPSGFEAAFPGSSAETVSEILRPICENIHTTPLGSVIGMIRSDRPDAKTLMLSAHIDQIGFLVSGITDEGFLRVCTIGGVDERMLPSCEVRLLTDPPIYGVFTSTPPHLLSSDDADRAAPIEELFIDADLLPDEAEKLVPVGTPAVFAEEPYRISEDTVTGPALDDRSGLAAILIAVNRILAEGPSPLNLAVVGSASEELGAYGALTAAEELSPDMALAVDVSHAKTPDAPDDKTFIFGGGAMVGMGPNLSTPLTRRIISLAEKNNVAYQREVMEGNTNTDAWTIQASNNGVPCTLLSIPLRYMHTPIETIRLSDLDAVSELIYLFIKSFGEEE